MAHSQQNWRCRAPLLALSALVAVSLLAPAGAAAVPAALGGQQCSWAGVFCDLSYSYIMAHIPDFLNATAIGAGAPPALPAPAAALLRAAARDAVCAAQATAAACRAAPPEKNCEWMDAEVCSSPKRVFGP
jgi:hypothetical protein